MTAAASSKILRVDASMRFDGSLSRQIADKLIGRLAPEAAPGDIVRRDLAAEAPAFVDANWIGANFTAPDERTDAHRATLSASDALVEELRAARTVVIASPVYNFGVPAALKAWIDQIARARVTFRYTENGPVGLLEGKKAYVVVATGGTTVESDIDFATPYLRHVLGFIGIRDVTVIAASKGDVASAEAAIAGLDLD